MSGLVTSLTSLLVKLLPPRILRLLPPCLSIQLPICLISLFCFVLFLFRLFTFHNPIHSEPGCCTGQPRIRVGCAPGLPWIRVLPNLPETTNPKMPRYPVTYWKIKSLPSAAGALCIC